MTGEMTEVSRCPPSLVVVRLVLDLKDSQSG